MILCSAGEITDPQRQIDNKKAGEMSAVATGALIIE